MRSTNSFDNAMSLLSRHTTEFHLQPIIDKYVNGEIGVDEFLNIIDVFKLPDNWKHEQTLAEIAKDNIIVVKENWVEHCWIYDVPFYGSALVTSSYDRPFSNMDINKTSFRGGKRQLRYIIPRDLL